MENRILQNDNTIVPDPWIYTKLDKEVSGCGNSPGGEWYILKNTHLTRILKVTIKVKWNYYGPHAEDDPPYILQPNSQINLGCTLWASSEGIQLFDRSISRTYFF